MFWASVGRALAPVTEMVAAVHAADALMADLADALLEARSAALGAP